MAITITARGQTVIPAPIMVVPWQLHTPTSLLATQGQAPAPGRGQRFATAANRQQQGPQFYCAIAGLPQEWFG